MGKKCQSKEGLKDLKKVVDFLKIITDENRVKILCFLKEKERCVCEIWGHFKMHQNLTSHHLKVLKDFELLFSRKEGLKVYYKLNKKVIRKYLQLLNKFLRI